MPGVSVITATRSGPTVSGVGPASTFFVAGLTERGPVNENIELHSMADYERIFGARVSYGAVYDALHTFFEEGGIQAYVARTVGAAATIGTLSLSDGAPLATVRIDAYGAGSWSSGVTVQVAAGTEANTVTITVRYGGVVEVYANLATPAAVVAALSASVYVRATDLGSATAAPGNNPAVLAATALSAGSDDRGAVAAATYTTALDRLGPGLGSGAVAVPGQAGTAIAAAVLTHCKANRRIGLLATTVASTPATAISQKATIQAAVTDEEYLGLFFPWVQIPDGAGGIRTISPEGYVAGVRARAQVGAGAWRAPGGAVSAARFVVDVESELTRAEGDDLDENEVSAIRTIGGGVRLYGWRSLSTDEQNYKLLTGRDTLNYLVAEGEFRLEQFAFRTIDDRGHLFSDMAGEIIGLVEPVRVAGGLYGIAPNGDDDNGYRVNTGPTVNTPTTIAAGQANVELSVRIAPTAPLVRLLITKVGLTANL